MLDLFMRSAPPPAVEGQQDATTGEYAQLSDIAYEPDARKKRKRAQALGYAIDDKLSGDYATVYYSESPFAQNKKRAVVAYRGTKLHRPDDLVADAAIALDLEKHTGRFKYATEIAEIAATRYGKNLAVTGHSLGGTMAAHVNEQLGYDAYAYNPGSNPLKKRRRGRDNLRVVRNNSDMISHGWSQDNRPLNVARGLGALLGGSVHGLRQFY